MPEKSNLSQVKSVEDLIRQPDLVESILEAIDAGFMPPEDEKQIEPVMRTEVVGDLQSILRFAVESQASLPRTPIRRMNRFQYNNAVQDLFELNVEVFPLVERMLREHGNYFQPATGKMPDVIKAGSRPLGKSQMIERRLAGVTPFPQDLRAEHGFDNRADHLTLSPLLLESFLRLGRSIVESPDFNQKTCGIWPDFFASPANIEDDQVEAVVQERLRPFLTRAFRARIDEETLQRYSQHVVVQIESGRSFTDAMKGAVAAVIASPRFFYLNDGVAAEVTDDTADFKLASRLSFFLWGSIPDQTLLDLAATGELRKPEVLSEQVDRMLKDRRLKRFCDSFPAQWLQLERIVSSTPDQAKYPQFYFSKYRASMHMMLEPLLLFETLLVEDQSVLKLIDSDFSYRSDLLNSWYQNGSQGRAGSPTVITFRRVPVTDPRQGGMITNAAVMTMTSGINRTKPITRGAWIAAVILNDPPEPPPADVPPLAEGDEIDEEKLTLRERFEAHRTNASCAGCHQRIDPLGFALENYNAAGIWRDTYDNGRPVDASGTLFGQHEFNNVVEFKEVLMSEKDRFLRAFAKHLLSFAIGREIGVEDSLVVDKIVRNTAADEYRFQSLIRNVVLSDSFLQHDATDVVSADRKTDR